MSTDRLPPIPPAAWTDAQRRQAEEIIRGPRGALVSPFVPLLRSPELMGHTQRMGEYLRFRSAIGLRLSELAILITARAWSQPVEWAIHAPIAQREGVAAETVQALAAGRRPAQMSDAEREVYDFCTELHREHAVSDATWAAAMQRLGEQGVVDLIGICGYYALLSMVMNAARTPVPATAQDTLPRRRAGAVVTPRPRALAFDVFGTVVDWHGGVAAEVAALAARHGVNGDWSAFANAWRAGYPVAMDRVRRGELPWQHIDRLHRMILDQIIPAHELAVLDEAEREHLNRAWHRLPPWPDAVPGLKRLKTQFTITPLSNGNFSLLTEMARHGGLPWDCIVSAELFRHYKPDPEVYLGCAGLLDIAPGELMLVACHPSDLRAAKRSGLRTAYVPRPREHGADTALPAVTPSEFDLVAEDFEHLAELLGA